MPPCTIQPSINFVVTGFGPFADQPTNPTQQLVADIEAHLPGINQQLEAAHASVVQTHVLDVALQPVDLFHLRLESMLASNPDQQPVFLHFGVDGR